MDRRRFLASMGVTATGLVAVPRLFGARAPTRPSAYVERWTWAMGQPVSLKLYAGSEEEGYEAAQAAFAELRRVEGRLSRFDAASDLTALNERAGGAPIQLDHDLGLVLRIADGIRRGSNGAFDPAIEPVMRAWGFHAERAAPPTERELAEAREAVREARLRREGERVALEGRGAALDLGGIGVGYGLDAAARVLRGRGIRSALLDVSGDCVAIGAPPGEPGWEIGIADPRDRAAPPVATVRLRDRALATSANTESVLEWRGRIVGHVMDPRTALPAARVRQVTVTAPSGVLADAWSTACLVAPVAVPRGCRVLVV